MTRFASIAATWIVVLLPTLASAQAFTLQVGPSVAVAPISTDGAPEVKVKAVFGVRSLGCTSAEGAAIAATAHGLETNHRRDLTLTLRTTPTGASVVSKDWPETGVWVIAVTGTCGRQMAGALVLPDRDGRYDRRRVVMLDGSPTNAQIDRALAQLQDEAGATARR